MSAHLRRVRHFLAYLRWHVDQGGRGVCVNRPFNENGRRAGSHPAGAQTHKEDL